MKTFFRLCFSAALSAFTVALLAPVSLRAQVPVSANHVQDPFQRLIISAKLCFAPVDAASNPAGFRVGSIQILPDQVCGLISNGVMQSGLGVAPTPTGIYYHIWAANRSTGAVLRDFGLTPITGSSWTLDTYDPNLVVLPVSALSVGTVTTLPPGSGASCTITGSGSPYQLNCSIPKGDPGVSGGSLAYPGVATDGANGLTVTGNIQAGSVDGVTPAVMARVDPTSSIQGQFNAASANIASALSGSANDATARTSAAAAQTTANTASTNASSALAGSANDSTARSAATAAQTTANLALSSGGGAGTFTNCTMDATGATVNDTLMAACLASLPSTGGTVYVGAGTYKFTAPKIMAGVNIKITGEGNTPQQGTPGGTIFESACASGGDVMAFNPAAVNQQGPEIDNIEFVDTSGTGACRSGLHIAQTNNVTLNDVGFMNFLGKTLTETVSFASGSRTITGTGFTAAMSPAMVQIAGINYEANYTSSTTLTLLGAYYGSATSPAAAVIHWNGAGLLVDGGTNFSQYWNINRFDAQNVLYPYRTVGSSSSVIGTSAIRLNGGFINCNRLPDSIGVWLGGFSDTTYPSLSINNCSVGVGMENAHANDIHGLRLENDGTASIVTTCNGGTAAYSCINGVIVGGATASNTYGNNLGGALIVQQGNAILLGTNALHTIVGPNSYRSNIANVADSGASTSLYDDTTAKLPGSLAWGGGSALASSNSIVSLSAANVFTANQEMGAQGTATSGANFPSYGMLFQISDWNGSSATTCGATLSAGPAAGTNAAVTWTFGTCGGLTFNMNMGALTGITFPTNTFKVNTVPNTSQNGLNVNNGSGITVSNPTYGNMQLDNALPVALTCTSGSPNFSATASVQSCTLSANIVAPVFVAGLDGFCTTFIIRQGASTAYTLAWPGNVKGGGTLGATLSGYNSQRFCYSAAATAWIASGAMITNL